MTDATFLTATEILPLYKTKQLSPVELTYDILGKIDQLNSTLNAYITVTPELAIEQAKQAEHDMMRGNRRGLLQGVPIGIKDNFFTKGIRTTGGSKILANFVPDYNATTVNHIYNSGAIILGKLNMHEFGGGLTNTNPFYGDAKNPWNIAYTPGGSSGGSGTALAAGLATLATGTDTFGSIRVPAAMCGIYGLKPTYGLVSTKGLFPLAWSLDHPGPMARSATDLALLLQVMAGYDPDDPASLNVPTPNYMECLNRDITGLKIGIPTYFLKGLDGEVERLFKRSISELENLGTYIIEVDIPELSLTTFAEYVTTTGEGATSGNRWLTEFPADLAQDVRIFLSTGAVTQTPQYVKAQQARRKLTNAMKNVFEKVDVLVSPTIPIKTPPFSSNWVEQNLDVIEKCIPFTGPANLTSIPSLSMPIGLDTNGLPVGMQVMGNHLSEPLLLNIASVWEKTIRGQRKSGLSEINVT